MSKNRESNVPSKGISRKSSKKKCPKDFTSLFSSFQNGLIAGRSEEVRDKLLELGIDKGRVEVGYNSGQFHHRVSDEQRQPLVEMGVLTPSDAAVKEKGMKAYTVWGKDSIVFPLKDEKDQIVNLFAYRFKLDVPKQEYVNSLGVYPRFPKKSSKRLYLTWNELEAASLLQTELLGNKDEVLALHNGRLTEDIIRAIKTPETSLELILLGKCSDELKAELLQNNIELSCVVEIPDHDTLNEFYLKYGGRAINELIEETLACEVEKESELKIISETEFMVEGMELTYKIYGTIPTNPTHLDMQFEIKSKSNSDVLRTRLNLMDSKKVEQAVFNWTEDKNLNYGNTIIELNQITEELQELVKLKNQNKPIKKAGADGKLIKEVNRLLRSEGLMKTIQELIGASGVVGNDKTRMVLFLIAASYKFKYRLHGVIQSNDVQLGAEFVEKIAALIPERDKYQIDLTTSKSFRYYNNQSITDRLMVIPDLTGVTSTKAIDDLKRLQANGAISIDAPKKTENGLIYTTTQRVEGNNSSIGSCSNSKRYFDNQPRTVLLGIDTTESQREKLMEYDCKRMAGLLDEVKENKAKELLQYLVDNLYDLEVVNPFAMALQLPSKLSNSRNLTMQLIQFVNLVTLVHQHQRQKDGSGRVITTEQDVEIGIDLFLDCILVQVDELNTNTRMFFEELKSLVLDSPNGKKTSLTAREIREALNVEQPTCTRYLKTLLKYEYIKKEGFRNKGYRYKIVYWSEMDSIKEWILNTLKTVKQTH